jgi:CDP-glycerol glycerophosphotransferase (TagB/SpsB family)
MAGGREASRFPSLNSIWFLARCGCVVVDEAAWFRQMRYFLLIRAKVVQLWHGIPIKRIELDHWRHEIGRYKWASWPPLLWLRLVIYRINGRWPRYAAVIATSSYYRDSVFAQAFLARHFPVTGYPRNDFAQSLPVESRDLAWSNVDSAVKSRLSTWRTLGRKLVLVAPTFRDSGSVPMQLDPATLLAIDAFAAIHGVEFLFKFHPSERNADHVSGRHFHVCARDSDVYPLLPYTVALVTDFSSISMDYLLLDRPLLFLIPSDDDYASNNRELQFDPRTMMPGPVVPDWPSMLTALLDAWAHDEYVQARAELRRKAFEDLPQADAVPKLIALMRKQRWVAALPVHRHEHKGQREMDS